MISDAELVSRTFGETIALHEQIRRGGAERLLDAAAAIVTALKHDGKVLLFGNGGSASDAQHAAAELVGRFERQREALAAVALTADASVVTAIANDEGYERIFARQIDALGRQGDVAVGITTSGRSANVVAGFEAAARRGMRRIALTGRDGGMVAALAEIHLNVPSASTPRIQEVHRTMLHVVCDLVERAFEPGRSR